MSDCHGRPLHQSEKPPVTGIVGDEYPDVGEKQIA